MLDLIGTTPNSQIRFESKIHQKYFNILLVDFLSCPNPKIFPNKESYLAALFSLCKNHCFDFKNSISQLQQSTVAFRKWLNTTFTIDEVWLPTINLKTDLSLTRVEYIKICGNISKHNFTRLIDTSNCIAEIFERNGVVITQEESFAILQDFYEWYHDDILNYHSSTIAEHLNNISWGIHNYLYPEYSQSIV